MIYAIIEIAKGFLLGLVPVIVILIIITYFKKFLE